MTSTKRKSRKVAWVVLGVVVFLLSLFLTLQGAQLWEWVRYREDLRHFGTFEIPVFVKRSPWLPGEDYVVGPHKCSSCTSGHHAICAGDAQEGERTILMDGVPDTVIPAGWNSCTCSDRVHVLWAERLICRECAMRRHRDCSTQSCECPERSEHFPHPQPPENRR